MNILKERKKHWSNGQSDRGMGLGTLQSWKRVTVWSQSLNCGVWDRKVKASCQYQLKPLIGSSAGQPLRHAWLSMGGDLSWGCLSTSHDICIVKNGKTSCISQLGPVMSLTASFVTAESCAPQRSIYVRFEMHKWWGLLIDKRDGLKGRMTPSKSRENVIKRIHTAGLWRFTGKCLQDLYLKDFLIKCWGRSMCPDLKGVY